MIGHSIGTLEAFKRFNEGKKVTDSHWDYDIIPKNLQILKEKYRIRFGKDIIPDDRDLTDRLFKAGVEMLTTTGFYCPDIGRSLTVSEDEISKLDTSSATYEDDRRAIERKYARRASKVATARADEDSRAGARRLYDEAGEFLALAQAEQGVLKTVKNFFEV